MYKVWGKYSLHHLTQSAANLIQEISPYNSSMSKETIIIKVPRQKPRIGVMPTRRQETKPRKRDQSRRPKHPKPLGTDPLGTAV